jgi:hypothetical protein
MDAGEGEAERSGAGKDVARHPISRSIMVLPSSCTTGEKRVETREGGRKWAHCCGSLLATADPTFAGVEGHHVDR